MIFEVKVRNAPRAGFSLLEVLVATVIAAILVGLLLSITQGLSTNFGRTRANIIRQGDTSVALDQLVTDLEGLVVPNTRSGEALKVTPETVQELTDASWITLLTTAIDKDTPTGGGEDFTGATRAVSYRIAYQDPLQGGTTDRAAYALYRSISSARESFDSALGLDNQQSGYWASRQGETTKIENFTAENVVRFSLRFAYRNQSGEEVWTTPGDTIRIGRDGATVNGQTIPGYFDRAEVAMTVLSPEGAQRLKDGIVTVDEAIQRYGQTAVRQTAFLAKP